MSQETFLVTGAMGCIGAWVLRNLVSSGTRVVAADLTSDGARPRLIMTQEELDRVTFVRADITDLGRLRELVEENGVTHIVHLAGLQVPFCNADPALGARVNVVGTVNVFEAARLSAGQVRGISYASSVAVFGPSERYSRQPVPDDAPLHPETLYGVYKQANESTARLYWQNWRIGSVGLRPYIVYGVGRDQGLTSDITKAILAATMGRPYHVKFGGIVGLQYADDVARTFIAAARASHDKALVCNLRNDVLDVSGFVSTLRAALPEATVTCATGQPLPFPGNLDDAALRQLLGRAPHTPLGDGVRDTIVRFRTLLAEGRIDARQLDT